MTEVFTSAALNEKGETPDEELARLLAEMQPGASEVEQHAARRERDAAIAEAANPTQSKDAPKEPTSTSIMRGMGPDGPEFIYIPLDVPKTRSDGSKVYDDWGEVDYERTHLRKRLSEFMLGDLAEAGYLISQIDTEVIRIALAWSFQRGEGDLNPHQAAAWIDAALPGEFEFYAGGISTLRAHEYKQYRGDRYYLLNIEYAANLGQHSPSFDRTETLRGLELVLFLDGGKAWNDGSTEPRPASPAWDAGVGLQTQGDGFHLYLAQDLRAPDDGPKITFRLGRSF